MIIFEGMTSIASIIDAIKAGKTDRQILEVWFAKEKNAKKFKEKNFLLNTAKELGFSFFEKDLSEIDQSAGGNTHGGIIAFCSDKKITRLDDASQLPRNGFLAILDGIEDPYNFGNCIRSLYAAGCDGLILPCRNWMSCAGTVARSSAGTSELLPMWECDAEIACKIAKNAGYRIVCAGIRDSVSMPQSDLSVPILLIVGGEKRGISRNVLDSCDEVVRIDYGRNFRGSLSATATVAVLGFEILNRRKR